MEDMLDCKESKKETVEQNASTNVTDKQKYNIDDIFADAINHYEEYKRPTQLNLTNHTGQQKPLTKQMSKTTKQFVKPPPIKSNVVVAPQKKQQKPKLVMDDLDYYDDEQN